MKGIMMATLKDASIAKKAYMDLLQENRVKAIDSWNAWSRQSLLALEDAITFSDVVKVLKTTPVGSKVRGQAYLKLIKTCQTATDVVALLSIQIGGIQHFWKQDYYHFLVFFPNVVENGFINKEDKELTPATDYVEQVIFASLEKITSWKDVLSLTKRRGFGELQYSLQEKLVLKGLTFCTTLEETAHYLAELEKIWAKFDYCPEGTREVWKRLRKMGGDSI